MSEATTENRMKVKNVWMIEKTLKKGLKQKMWEKDSWTIKEWEKGLMNNATQRTP